MQHLLRIVLQASPVVIRALHSRGCKHAGFFVIVLNMYFYGADGAAAGGDTGQRRGGGRPPGSAARPAGEAPRKGSLQQSTCHFP